MEEREGEGKRAAKSETEGVGGEGGGIDGVRMMRV